MRPFQEAAEYRDHATFRHYAANIRRRIVQNMEKQGKSLDEIEHFRNYIVLFFNDLLEGPRFDQCQFFVGKRSSAIKSYLCPFTARA